ncbi:RHS repeat-associated core domain-containing protein [Pseudomonas umsongensis]|jgi:RHS repeat-associated protein|nr:RHS repeat-associated core domain-containing protein [Pseudomonas umsongensis]NWL22878.1 RHS repeat-associated core domain-containing protein [Pseudomonas umsongensis]
MTFPQQNLLCLYRYDPLDRLISHTQSQASPLQRFYCKSRLASETQGALHHSIVQHDDLLLAQQQRQDDVLDTTFLATDLQRSILQTLKANQPRHSIAYSPYGHRHPENGLLSLLGFNGERPDRVTGHYLLGNGYRAFNPVLMRFNSPDSWSPFGKGGLNPYAYCVGDPINRYDPNGHANVLTIAKLWRARATAKLAARADAVEEVTRTNVVEIFHKKYFLKPGVTPVQAVKARERIYYLQRLAEPAPTKNAKYYHDLDRARSQSARIEKLTGMPANNNERLKLLNYIKGYEPEVDSAFSYKKLGGVMREEYDPRLPISERPTPDSARQYYQELTAINNPDSAVLVAEANRIRDLHFTAG